MLFLFPVWFLSILLSAISLGFLAVLFISLLLVSFLTFSGFAVFSLGYILGLLLAALSGHGGRSGSPLIRSNQRGTVLKSVEHVVS